MNGDSLRDHVTAALAAPVRELEAGRLTGSFRFPANSGVFAGHFPGRPVLPGIAQMMAALLVAGGGTMASLRHVKRCKFSRAVLPNEEVVADVRLSGGGDQLLATAELHVNEERCASMSLVVGRDEADGDCP